MKELSGKVAVITGAASGIGRALARKCAAEAMKLTLADVEQDALAATEAELRTGGASVVAVRTDVSRAEDVQRLAEKTLDAFGAVHLLFNNAGVGLVGPAVWEATREDWEWVLDVNLRGAFHCLQVFVPIMLKQATSCHIVNTASAAGLLATPSMGVYSASKAGLIVLSETMHHELVLRRAMVRVSVLCPGLVDTRILDASRNRPANLRNAPEIEAVRRARYGADEEDLRRAMVGAMSPEHLADCVIDAIRHERFYIITHPWVRKWLKRRTRNILRGRDPWKGTGYKEPES